MKRVVLSVVMILMLPVVSFGGEKKVTIIGGVGMGGTMIGEFNTDEGEYYGFEYANKDVNDKIYEYCSPKCKMTVIIDTDNEYIDRILSIETVK